MGGIISFEGVDPVARYYIEMEGYRYGPFELQELKQLNQDGVLRSDQIYEEQSNQLCSLTRLLAEYSSQPSPEPIPQAQSFGSHGEKEGLPETSSSDGGTADSASDAAAAQEVFGSGPSESWSERLSRLKAARNEQTGGVAENPVFSGRSDSPAAFNKAEIGNAEADLDAATDTAKVDLLMNAATDKTDLIMDAASNELMEEMVANFDDLPSEVKNEEELPDLLVSSGPHPEELINYSAPIIGDIKEPDLKIKLKGLGENEGTAADDANAGGFPTSLGYMKDTLDLEPPMEWLTKTGPAMSATPAFTVSASPESSTVPEKSQAPQRGERSADEASAWREQMARLDVVYGVRESTASKELQSFGQDRSTAAMSPQMGGESGVPGIDGEFADSEDEHQEKSSVRLGSLVFITAGLVALLAHSTYMPLTEMPNLVVTVVLYGYALLTAICGVFLWIDARRLTSVLSIVLLCLLLCPLAVLGYTLFIYKDSVMALQISKTLQLPLAYTAASLIMHALGLASLKKTAQIAENA